MNFLLPLRFFYVSYPRRKRMFIRPVSILIVLLRLN